MLSIRLAQTGSSSSQVLCLIAFWGLCFCQFQICAENSYHIGNSQTSDSVGGGQFNGDPLEAIALQQGKSLVGGFHIDSGQSLQSIHSNPDGVNGLNGALPAKWSLALPTGGFDFITFQPHESGGSTLGSDRAAIANFIAQVPDDPTYFVLQTWPSQLEGAYSSYWEGTVVDSDLTATTKQAEYYDILLMHLREDHANNTIWMVPTGEVLYQLDQQILAGTLPEATSVSYFYVDNLHMDRTVGRYMAAATLYSVMFQQKPMGLTIPVGFFSNGTTPSAALLNAINLTIWDVISTSPWSGYSDFDRDGVVGGNDLDLLSDEFGLGRDGADYLAWARQYNASSIASLAIAIPEPATCTLAVFVLSWPFGFFARRGFAL